MTDYEAWVRVLKLTGQKVYKKEVGPLVGVYCDDGKYADGDLNLQGYDNVVFTALFSKDGEMMTGGIDAHLGYSTQGYRVFCQETDLKFVDGVIDSSWEEIGDE